MARGHQAKQPKAPKLKRAAITTLVLNGTTQAGLARDTSYKLGQQGFHTVQLPPTIQADAPTQDYATTLIYYDAVQANAKAAAQQLAVAFGATHVVAPLPPEFASFAQESGNPLTIVVVGIVVQRRARRSAGRDRPDADGQTPNVRNDPGYALDRRCATSARRSDSGSCRRTRSRAARTSPRSTRCAPTSRPSVMAPSCSTFHTAAGNVYWQIEETNWNDAPVIRHPTQTVTLRGRTYDLYTTGGNIHMVVLRESGASYWVVNTLRDELSNETMLAIAKGLQPLGK